MRFNFPPIDVAVPFDLAANLVKATQTLTSDATNPANGGTLTVGTRVYTLVSTITAAVAASAVLTSDNTNVTAGKKVVAGLETYTFVDALTAVYGGPRSYVKNEVLIGADADTSMNNLRSAINGTVADYGVKYSKGTKANTLVSAGTLSAHAFTVTARVTGTVGNAYAKSEDSTHLDWDGTGAFLTGGVDTVADQIKIGTDAATTLDNIKAAINGTGTPGTEYSVGTVANTQVTATTNAATTQVIQAITGGCAANAIATTVTATHLSWGAATMAGGGGTVGKYTFTEGGFVHRFITIIGDIVGTGTTAIALYSAAGALLKTLVATQAQSNTTDTAYEVEIQTGDYLTFTASALVNDTDTVGLHIR